MNKTMAYLIGTDMIAKSNRDLGNVIAESNREYAKKLEEISKSEIKSKDRVDITLEKYESMKKQIEWLDCEVRRLQSILKKIEVPFELDIIPDSIETAYCDDYLNRRKIFNVRFAYNDWEVKRNGFN